MTKSTTLPIYLVTGLLEKETDKAALITVNTIEGKQCDPVASHWFPKTQIVDMHLADDVGDEDRFNIKHWIMAEKGLV